MRLTCLKCGHQIVFLPQRQPKVVTCVCGHQHSYPNIVDTGAEPSEKEAERSRFRAFRAAGLVKNMGGISLGIALLGILFFPLALLGAGLGIYVLTILRGPISRYSGRNAAIAAILIGTIVFIGEGSLALKWYQKREHNRYQNIQLSVMEDLHKLLRIQRLFHTTHDSFGSFSEFRFSPNTGYYTIYLGREDVFLAKRWGKAIRDPLPDNFHPQLSEKAFTAVAVANIDHDEFLDIWTITDFGTITHFSNDWLDQQKQQIMTPAISELRK